MADHPSVGIKGDEPSPLHELISRILESDESSEGREASGLPMLGTMQQLNQRLANQPGLDFINYTLRGIGQVIFLNNPLSGLLILAALFIQSPWVGTMGLVAVVASTLTAIWLRLDRDSIRNGLFGYNGILVGVALATFGMSGNGAWNPAWAIAAIVFSAMTTVFMKTMGLWFVTKFKVPLLTLPFNIATLLFLSAALFLPQPYFNLGASAPSATTSNAIDWFRIAQSLPIGFGQVFLADKLASGILVFLAVALCTPVGAAVGLLGCILGVLAGGLVGVAPEKLYAGLWGYNALLCAMAIGGVFYAPTARSILIGAACAFLGAIAGGVLGAIFAPLGLPVLTLPFCIVTIGFFLVLQRSLPSLVPVALHAVTSPEEHWQRYLAAKHIINNFRRQLEAAMVGKRRNFFLEKASASIKGDLRYLFDAIDTNRNGEISPGELAMHLRQAGVGQFEGDLAYLFKCMDVDGSGSIDFEEFGELMLRHRSLISKYTEFVTYFLPIDANQDDSISIDEIKVVMSSVDEASLSVDEVAFLQMRTSGQPMTWNQFIEVLLVT